MKTEHLFVQKNIFRPFLVLQQLHVLTGTYTYCGMQCWLKATAHNGCSTETK